MKKTTLIITTVALFMFASAGCEETNTASRENNNNDVVAQETNTPLGCDRDSNRYYDFIETKECLRPTTYEQLYVLDKFRRANELAAEDPEKVIEIQVNFKHYPTAEEFEAILDESIKRVTYIGLFFPNFADGSGFPTHIRDEAITKEQAFQYAMDENRVIAKNWSAQGLAEHYGAFTDSMLEGYQIQGARFSIKQGDIAEWWLRHNSLIRVVQIIISDFDHAQFIFKPEEKIGPEDQSIDWEGV